MALSICDCREFKIVHTKGHILLQGKILSKNTKIKEFKNIFLEIYEAKVNQTFLWCTKHLVILIRSISTKLLFYCAKIIYNSLFYIWSLNGLILPIRPKTLSNQSINQSFFQIKQTWHKASLG